MPTFQKAPPEAVELASEVLTSYAEHKPLLDARVKIDFLFAFASVNDNGERVGCALTHHGCRALGIARKLSLKDRAAGRGDAEITIDGDWWNETDDDERRALLDHELYHLSVKMDGGGVVKRDDLQRPVLSLRKHDFEFGWFEKIAARHGECSLERAQARQIMDQSGQFFWPELFNPIAKVA